MLSVATLRWSALCLGFPAIVLLGATPTDRTAAPSLPLAAAPPPLFAAPSIDPPPADQPPHTPERRSVVELSEAEVAEALKIMKRLDHDILAGTLMEHPVKVEPQPSVSVRSTQRVELLREVASRVDALANRLESADLYQAADQLRREADALRRRARRLRPPEIRPSQIEPDGQPTVISRRRNRRNRRR